MRKMIAPYPNIYQSQGQSVPSLRCPACGSSEYSGIHCFIDEQYTWALNPVIFRKDLPFFRYQRYIILTCRKCHYSYHFRPEGLWYENKHPMMGSSSFIGDPKLNSSQPGSHLSAIEIPEKIYVGRIELFDPSRQELKILAKDLNIPIYDLPDAYGIFLIGGGHPNIPIAKFQDFRLLDLAKKKRYSDTKLNQTIINAPIALMTGAGFSASLGFPTVGKFKKLLPEKAVETLSFWMHKHKTLLDRAWEDYEILLDILFRIQRLAILCASSEEFQNRLNKWEHTSLFIFREVLPETGRRESEWSAYPPIAHLQPRPEHIPYSQTPHFRQVREIVHDVVLAMILACHTLDAKQLKKSTADYLPFLEALSTLNGGIIPVYTTNYDLVIEHTYAAVNEANGVLSGLESPAQPSPEFSIRNRLGQIERFSIPFLTSEVSNHPFDNITDKKIVIFHLHGASNWFVNRDTGQAIAIHTDREGLKFTFEGFWRGVTSWLPGIVPPSTVKDAYTITHPFNIGYDYLAEQIKNASLLVIIGQRLRDETLKEMVYWSSMANPALKYVVLDLPEEELGLCHILDCIPSSRLKYFGGGFPERSTDLLSYCRKVLSER